MSKETKLPSEWSYLVDAREVTDAPTKVRFEASEEERKNLARRLNVIAIDYLYAEATLARSDSKHVVTVSGRFKANLVQSCSISGEPVKQSIEDDFTGWFAEPDQVVSLIKVKHERDGIMDGAEQQILDEKDDPEPFVNGKVDVGELASQYLSLSIDNFVHSDVYALDEDGDVQMREEIPAVRKNPFEALKDLKIKDK